MTHQRGETFIVNLNYYRHLTSKLAGTTGLTTLTCPRCLASRILHCTQSRWSTFRHTQ